MRRFCFVCLTVVGLSGTCWGFYLDFNVATGFSSQVIKPSKNYEMFQISSGESFFNESFFVETSLQMWIDQRFKGTDGVTAFYFRPNYGGIRIDYGGFRASLGYYQPHDRVDTPYALFLNSAYLIDPLANSHSRPSINVAYDNKYLFFDYNWTALQWCEFGKPFYAKPVDKDGKPIPEDKWKEYELLTGDPRLIRAYNYKCFGGKVGGFSFAYQDVMLYSNRIFDWAYTLVPLPSVLVQYTRSAFGNPGAEKINDQSIMGIFLSYTNEKDLYLYGQLLVDDVSLGIFYPGGRKNPFKIAWSVGGWYQVGAGRLGFFHAGATKYTFQTIEGENKAYTFNSFNFFDNGRFLEAQDTWIGYKNGENNISFLFAYQSSFLKNKLRYKTALELCITGSQSPNPNAWTESTRYFEGEGWGTRILTGPLETKFLSYNSLGYELLEWLDISFDSKLGFAYNAMELYYPKPNEQLNLYPYLRPGKQTKLIFDLRLSVRFYFDWKFGLKKGDRKPRPVSKPTVIGEPIYY